MNELPSLPFLPDEPTTEEKLVGTVSTPGRVGKTDFLGDSLEIYGSAERPWFNAPNASRLLGLARVDYQLRQIPEKDKLILVLQVAGQRRKVTLISLPGLCRLIYKSRKAEAVAFQDHIFDEVIPALWTWGQYPPPKRLPGVAPLKLTPELDALIPTEARTLPLRRQMILAERLFMCRAVELATHPSMKKKIASVCKSGTGKRRGWSWGSVYRHHRNFTEHHCDWRVLLPHFENAGRPRKEVAA